MVSFNETTRDVREKYNLKGPEMLDHLLLTIAFWAWCFRKSNSLLNLLRKHEEIYNYLYEKILR